ncbi:MAG: NAD(P)-binding domain-containing protein [Pseudomonadota bacterium]
MSLPNPCGQAGAVDVVVIGAGHCGLAVSFNLTSLGIAHVVLERGAVANSWRKERWDSLRLLTPNWMSSLPGQAYEGSDPDGFMTMPEVADFVAAYAARIDAPVRTNTTVTRVHAAGDGYRVETTQGNWQCRALVIASGAFNTASLPKVSQAMPVDIAQVTAHQYKNPAQLAEGGVLVVGASATGLQLADEIARSGRAVTLAAGEHVRLPRRYRGRDIKWWMQASGLLDECIFEAEDLARLRRVPSPQLVGSPDNATLDLNALRAQGVRITGRLMGVRDGKAQFSGSLRNVCQLADLKMNRLLKAIDEFAADAGIDAAPAETFEPTQVDATATLSLKLDGDAVKTVVWATGFRPDYSWLDVPVLDRKGNLRHTGGVVDAPGLYAMGLPFMRRRKSSFMHGAADDARDITQHLAGFLANHPRDVSVTGEQRVAV